MGGKGGKPDVPDAGDYIQVARQEGEIAKDLLREQTRANRPDQVTPYGSTVWEDLGDNRWRQEVTLPEESQLALEAQQRLGRDRSEFAEEMLGRARGEMGEPIAWQPMEATGVSTGADARSAAEEALYDRFASRLDPAWEQRESEVYNQLWNQGLRPGDEAWNTAMGNLGRERTDAYQRAIGESVIFGGAEAEREFGMDMRRRQQAISEELQRRGATLNEVNALMSGQQVSAPSMPGVPRAGVAPPPSLTGAMGAGAESELMRYNAGQMQDQGLMAGVTGLLGAWAPFAFSDRRLKSNVKHIGHTLGGQPVYSYTMFGHHMIGVMADETPPDLVKVHPSGYLMVDYSRVK